MFAIYCGVKMNNTTSVETFDLSDLDSHMHVTLSIITGTACPLGVLATLHLILKTIKKSARRLWDHLTLAMEVLCHWLTLTVILNQLIPNQVINLVVGLCALMQFLRLIFSKEQCQGVHSVCLAIDLSGQCSAMFEVRILEAE